MTWRRRRPQQVDVAVAVILRTKDRPDFLREALHDVLAQRFDDYRLVVVNDGGSVAAVEEILDQARVDRQTTTVIHHAKSLGRARAANAGIAACNSTYVVLHDDDDSWEPDFLTRSVDFLRTHSTDGVVTRCGVAHDIWDGAAYVTQHSEVLHSTTTHITLSGQLQHNLCPTIAFVYLRDLHSRLGGYDPSLPQLEDWDFSLRILASGATIGFIDGPPLAWWHLRSNETGASQNVSLSDTTARQMSINLMLDKHLRAEVSGSSRIGSAFLSAQQSNENQARFEALESHLQMVSQHLTTILERQRSLLESLSPLDSRQPPATDPTSYDDGRTPLP